MAGLVLHAKHVEELRVRFEPGEQLTDGVDLHSAGCWDIFQLTGRRRGDA